ncbi:MAG: hypothetical protein R2705_00090 [Ilumatobacteraceae bacterium]
MSSRPFLPYSSWSNRAIKKPESVKNIETASIPPWNRWPEDRLVVIQEDELDPQATDAVEGREVRQLAVGQIAATIVGGASPKRPERGRRRRWSCGSRG